MTYTTNNKTFNTRQEAQKYADHLNMGSDYTTYTVTVTQ